ncbi:MAG: ArdC-like ssDNA-binding domain-containing protein, partial [Longicatena sp.]
MNKLYDVINSKTQGDSERKHERVAPDVFAQQMKEKRETLNEKVSDMLEEVSNDPQQYMNFLDTVAKFEQYSITNSLLIMAQKPDATIIKDNSKWRENKCYVKKGEKAFQILEPGEAYQRSDGTSGINYNIKSMFDISQLSTPPIMHQKEALNTEEVLSALTYKTPVKIDVVAQNENGENAYFSEHENTIHLSSNLNEADMLNGLTREMCYAEMREMYGTLDRDGFAFSAESATYLLC